MQPNRLSVNSQFQLSYLMGNTSHPTFGKRVLQARLNLAAKRGRPVTQQEIADALGVTGVTVGRWEGDRKEPDLATISQLAQVLEVDPKWLAFGASSVTAPSEDVPRAFEPEPRLVTAAVPVKSAGQKKGRAGGR